jgi:hypothetical protein
MSFAPRRREYYSKANIEIVNLKFHEFNTRRGPLIRAFAVCPLLDASKGAV